MPKKTQRSTPKPSLDSSHIAVRGARQNNLQGVDVDIPTGQLTVVTGPSGSGKSSLAFATLYAEGQRRYIETFSPYTRQFFERMDKPQVDAIEGIPPAIALEQKNAVKSTRSTVGTMTELNDYLKVLFAHHAQAHCPECGQRVQPENPSSILEKLQAEFAGQKLLLGFEIPIPPKTAPTDFFAFLQSQGYLRCWLYGEVVRTDATPPRSSLPAQLFIIQDRPTITPKNRSRLREAIETSLDMGKGQMVAIEPESASRRAFSRDWRCADCDRTLTPPTPGLFSFNHPLGACPTCRGFGRTIGIDLERALPDKSRSLRQGVVTAFQGATYGESQRDLLRTAKTRGLDLDTPFMELPRADQHWVIEGERGAGDNAWEEGLWYGVRGFFDWLENNVYKMHVRVFLSRFRAYTLCPDCQGARLQPEALCYTLPLPSGERRTLPELWTMPLAELAELFAALPLPDKPPTIALMAQAIRTRLGYLLDVGLGYLTLDRPTRSLSGGETERVNLTTCLGASLVNTLFVLDEPTVGLHPRDTEKLIAILQNLRDQGNTLVVVEHEESVMRAADHLIDIGPGRGRDGGQLVYAGSLPDLLTEKKKNCSLTAAYLSGRQRIATPAERRPPTGFLELRGVRAHNIENLDARLPLGVLGAITGVSGSGKSTLIHKVLYGQWQRHRGQSTTEEPGHCRSIRGFEKIEDIVLVDQSPLAKSPRSTPAVFTGAFDLIRQLFSETTMSRSRGLTPGYFSFNSSGGRCERCAGQGFEKVEMQFLSDLYLRCPECEGRRYQAEALELTLWDKNIAQILELTASEALELFSAQSSNKSQKIATILSVLEKVGLGYLQLGQGLNTLSGGEAQRLKLVQRLLDAPPEKSSRENPTLLLLDEPTTGLHFDDIARLLDVFDELIERGQSILVIEHNLDVMRRADYLIDLGPDAGSGGGQIVAAGTPEEVAQHPSSHTARYLSSLFAKKKSTPKPRKTTQKKKPLPIAHQHAITLHGAREHNLKNIDLSIPRDAMVVVTGLSGSGKSTLAFDILFAEGQRRFLDSMSPYARQFVEQLEKPDIDLVTGLPPTVAIEQRISRGGAKSTVGTITETYHFLRLLYSKVGTPHCPYCSIPVEPQSIGALVQRIARAQSDGPVKLLAPLVKARKGYHTEVAQWALQHGFETLLVDRQWQPAADFKRLDRYREHSIDALVAEFTDASASAIRPHLERALEIGKGTARLLDHQNHTHILSTERACPQCGHGLEELDPRLFSFNSPHGWCPDCRGYGTVVAAPRLDKGQSQLEAELREEWRQENEAEITECPTCLGARLNAEARAVKMRGEGIAALGALSLDALQTKIQSWKFAGREKTLTRDILPEIAQRLQFIREVGLGYLQLDRAATTLSGGEAQRLRLAAQLGSNLKGVLYILDEPTIGLHPSDNAALLKTLHALRDRGNSLVVVEHDDETMEAADYIVDLGPGAGRFGGEVIATGHWSEIVRNPDSVTGQYLCPEKAHPWRGARRPLPSAKDKASWLQLTGARLHNLRDVDCAIPLGRLTVLTGVSGAGKSTLLRGVLLPAVKEALAPKKQREWGFGQSWGQLTGAESLRAVYEVDQSPIGKTSRSTPATYVKILDPIRQLYAQAQLARLRGYSPTRFSFNTEGGRCETCGGNGQIKLEMAFLPTTYMHCEACNGLRYNTATLEVHYREKSIGEVLQMTVDEAVEFFEAHPKIHRTLTLLQETGLGYLQLGQPSPTLSGGEAQRLKLVAELTKGRGPTARPAKGRASATSNLYLIEEPSIGLHLADVQKLVTALHRLVDEGHSVVVIEHHLDLIAEADYVIDIGPGAGEKGGRIVARGTPEKVAQGKSSHTGQFLRRILEK